MAGLQIVVPTLFTDPTLPKIVSALPGSWASRWMVDLTSDANVSSVPDINGGVPMTAGGNTGSTKILAVTTDARGYKYATFDNTDVTAVTTLTSVSPSGVPTEFSTLMVARMPAQNGVGQIPLGAYGASVGKVSNANQFQISWSPYSKFNGTFAADAPVVFGFRRSVAGGVTGWMNETKTSGLLDRAPTTNSVGLNVAVGNNQDWSFYEVATAPVALTDEQMLAAITSLKSRYGIV